MAHQPNPRGGSEGQGPPLSDRGDTIAAVATPSGRGGIGIVRVSGPLAPAIAKALCGFEPAARQVRLATFRDGSRAPIDEGLVIAFAAPSSYTGEPVVEFQGHGGPVVVRRVLARVIELGARIAEPGEFTRRAFLNDRMDLAQAESVADLIDASSEEAARSAARSLVGEFSRQVHELVEGLTHLRTHVEACIDFPEEEIDPADRQSQAAQLRSCLERLDRLLRQSRQGAVLRDGLTVVLIGRPNVGKSSLLNRFAGDEVAIVTPIPGTTRDYVKATVHLEGVPVHLVDTAGLREADDEVERLGIERSWKAAEGAGAVLFLSDNTFDADLDEALIRRIPAGIPVARVLNKVDLLDDDGVGPVPEGGVPLFRISALRGDGLESLAGWMLEVAGWRPTGEGVYLARERHLSALATARSHVAAASSGGPLEVQAEELRLAQVALGRITGEVSADEILGHIFSSFCIGK